MKSSPRPVRRPLLALLGAFFLLAFPLPAQVPQLLTYQGRVVVNGVNFQGTGRFKFAVLDESGLTTLWSNDGQSNGGSEPATAVFLTVSNGLYSVLLGDSSLPGMTTLPPTLFSTRNLQLRVWFDDGQHGSQQLTPDQRIAAVGYALMAAGVAKNSVTSAQFVPGAVDTNALAPGAVTSVQIAPGAVGPAQLAAGAVGTAQLAPNAVDSAQLANGAVGPLQIAPGSVGAMQLANLSVGVGKIVDGSITSPKIFPGSVDTTALGNASVTAPKIAPGAVGSSQLATGAVGSNQLAAGAVGNAQLAAGAAAANLYGTGQAGVTVFSAGDNPGLVAAGYVKIGTMPFGGDVWQARSIANGPNARQYHASVWTGSEMIVWGGIGVDANNMPFRFGDGGRYNPATNNWTTMIASGAPSARADASIVWTGTDAIIWGGSPDGGNTAFNTGSRYRPSTNSWNAVAQSGAPSSRYRHTAVWTGSEMIVWGGADASNFLLDGARYNPTTNSWATMVNAPLAGRYSHTVVWTGSQMIVWGGYGAATWLGDGARYTPTLNSWNVLSSLNAPSARYDHTAVWTGSEMIIWGGPTSFSTFAGDGARYNPSTGSWTATQTAGQPAPRGYHSAVWTGTEMIVWGGFDEAIQLNRDGARFDPAANVWTAMQTAVTPPGRAFHSVVWTGSAMLIFGGSVQSGADTALTAAPYSYVPGGTLTVYQHP